MQTQCLKICYQGKERYLGTFEDKDDAILANVNARRWLDATRDSKLTNGEIILYLKLAKEAVREAVNDEAMPMAPTVPRVESRRPYATDHITPKRNCNTSGIYRFHRSGGDKWVTLHLMHILLSFLLCGIIIHRSIKCRVLRYAIMARTGG